MHSIPAAMSWEILARGKWTLLAAALGALALPAMILSALETVGAIDAQNPSIVVIHIVMVHINVSMFGAASLIVQRRMSQYYAYPVRTSTIVAWRLIPMMALVAVQTALGTVVLNYWFELGWPIWGPAMFVAVAFAAVVAAFWLAEKSAGWMIVGVALIAAVLGTWFKSRYGAAFGEPSHYWQQISALEFFTMLGMAATAYWVAVEAVARNRRGEAPLSLGIVDRLSRYLDVPASRSTWQSAPVKAQLWLEWRRKGWVMPFTALVLLAIGLIILPFASANANEFFLGLVHCGLALWPISFLGGIIMGNVSTNPGDGGCAMGQYLATRPTTDTQMARTVLRMAATSVLLAWLVWVVAVSIACAILLFLGAGDAIQFPPGFTWWSFPGILFVAWIIVGVLASIGLTGSERVFQYVTGLAFVVLVLPLLSKLLLSTDARQLVMRIVMITLAGAVVTGTIWIYLAALRRALIQATTAWGAAGVCAAATAGVVILWPWDGEPHWLGCLLAASVLALAVAPLGAAPLALSANRHR